MFDLLKNYPKKYAALMTGSLAARYKSEGGEPYKKEYIRRLKSIGFTTDSAEDMFSYETGLLSDASCGFLADDSYIMSSYFDLNNVLLADPLESYIENQTFTCTEATKIWDEAEWHHANSQEMITDEAVREEIYTLCVYRSGSFITDYLDRMAQESGVDKELMRRYSMSEQGMLFAFKWNGADKEKHPYGVKGL